MEILTIKIQKSMLYSEYRQLSSDDACHFCDPEDRAFVENADAFLTYAIAPYHEHHLLVIPKRHRASFLEMERGEFDQVWDLIRKGAAILLELGYETYTVIVREGKNAAKSMEHLHYHLIPNNRIGDLDHAGQGRSVMEASQIDQVSRDVREAMDRLKFNGI